MKSATPTPPKKVGRPATGRDPVITVRLPKDLVAELDRRAQAQGLKRAQALREIAKTALKPTEE